VALGLQAEAIGQSTSPPVLSSLTMSFPAHLLAGSNGSAADSACQRRGDRDGCAAHTDTPCHGSPCLLGEVVTVPAKPAPVVCGPQCVGQTWRRMLGRSGVRVLMYDPGCIGHSSRSHQARLPSWYKLLQNAPALRRAPQNRTESGKSKRERARASTIGQAGGPAGCTGKRDARQSDTRSHASARRMSSAEDRTPTFCLMIER
jgi:hypothetical protein